MKSDRRIVCTDSRREFSQGCPIPHWILPRELDWTSHQGSFDLLGTTHPLEPVDRSMLLPDSSGLRSQWSVYGLAPSLEPDQSNRRSETGVTGKLGQLLRATWRVCDYQPCTIDQGIVWLGSGIVKQLLLVSDVFTLSEKSQDWPFHTDQLWAHSVRTGYLAGRLVKAEGGDAGTMIQACLAGFAHDIGLAIFAASLDPNRYLEVMAQARRENITLATAELLQLGISHEIIGAEFLQRQNFGPAIIQAVSFHDNPVTGGRVGFTPTLAVCAANILDGGGWPQDSDGVPSDQMIEHLAAQGYGNPWSEWQRYVRELEQLECGRA